MLPDKMAISHSNHLFVSLAFVFCLLSPPLAHTTDSYDYTEPRQPGKNLAVSKHGNNTQRLANYNWKPPDKYHGPRERSTERKAEMEFTKPADPEQRAVDPWIKKMQEIRRQEREKWAGYKRNENGALTLDNVEETTKAGELTSDESITKSISENMETERKVGNGPMTLESLLENNDNSSDVIIKEISDFDSSISDEVAQHLPALHDNARLRLSQNSTRLNSEPSADKNADGELSGQKISSHRWGMSVKDPPAGFLLEARASHRQLSDDKTGAETRVRNATADRTKSELEEDRSLGSAVTLRPKEASLERSSSQDHEKLKNSRKNLGKIPQRNGSDFSSESHFVEFPAKERPRQSSLSRGDSEESGETCDGKDDEGTVTANSLTQKKTGRTSGSDTRDRNATGKPLNHRRSFQPGKWGMSVSSPPKEFLRDVSRQATHRKNKKHAGDEENVVKVHRTDRWTGSSVPSPSGGFQADVPKYRGSRPSGRTSAQVRSRSGEVQGSSNDRSPALERRQKLQTDLAERRMIDERDKELAASPPGGLPSDHDRFRDRWLGKRPASEGLNIKLFPRSVHKVLIREFHALWYSDSEPNATMMW